MTATDFAAAVTAYAALLSGDGPADPYPRLRCRCVAWMRAGGWRNDFTQRCTARATQEDGMCDHCRQDVCNDPTCADPDGNLGRGCCLQEYGESVRVDLNTPCMAVPS